MLPPIEEEGGFYEGWLVNPDSKKFISTGPMTISDDQTYRMLTYSDDVDYTDYSQVVITKELIKDAIPEEHIIEGSFLE